MNLPKLMKLEDWRKKRFEPPIARSTAMRWAEEGSIPAKKIGGRWFVDVGQEMNETNDELVDNVLRAG